MMKDLDKDVEKHFNKVIALQKGAAKNILDTLKEGGVVLTIEIINSVYDNLQTLREGFTEMEKEFFLGKND